VKTKRGLLLELGKWDRVPSSGDCLAAREPWAYAVPTEALRHVSSNPAGGPGLDRHRSPHAEANVQRTPSLTECPAFGDRRGHRQAPAGQSPVPTINAYDELLPKRTEHHCLQAFFLVGAMDERVRVLEALQRRIQIPF
jgi:hypothetical protein